MKKNKLKNVMAILLIAIIIEVRSTMAAQHNYTIPPQPPQTSELTSNPNGSTQSPTNTMFPNVDFTCASSMSPSFGPEVGGTVVKIENGSSGGCPLRSDADILCRFENDDKSFSNLVPGILVKLEGSNIVECVSPFSGQPMNVRVSYAAILNKFDIDEATFFEVDEEFQYIGDRAGLILDNARPSNPSPAPFSSPQDSSNIPYYTFPPTINADSSPYHFYERRLEHSDDCNDDTPNTTPFRIEIQHGDDPYYPEELFWKVSQEQGLGYTIEIASGYLPEGNEFYEEKLCLDSRECYFFELEHYYNYALYDGGTFMIFYDDNIIGEGGAFEGTFESIRFGNRCTSPQRNEPPTDLQFFFAGNMIQAKWNSDALRLSTFREYASREFNYDYEGKYISREFKSSYDFTVNVEILAYDATADTDRSPFVKIQSFNPLSVDSNGATFVLDNATVSPFMIDWGSNKDRVAVILIRVVAYSIQSWNEDDPNAQWILATRTSKLVGVLPQSMEETMGECPISYNQDCEIIDNSDLCPPSYDIALEDLSFSPDNSCPWPSGNNACDTSLDLKLDFCITSCLSPNTFPTEEESSYCSYYSGSDECEFNEDTLDEIDGCPCASSHPGATGCVNDGLTQCCYTEDGALITEYVDGAGRPKCIQSGVTSIASMDIFLFDTLPYLLCCGLDELDDACESYYSALPDNFLEDGYENPTAAAVSFGDPHIVTFDRVNYNFNGFGEYVAVCGGPASLDDNEVRILCSTSRGRLEEDDERTSIHFRFRPFLLGNNQLATVNAGIAIQDPSFHNGAKRLTIILDSSDRLIVYEGDTRVIFPAGRRNRVRQMRSGASISQPRETNRTMQVNFVLRIRFKSGLTIKISEAEGVMNPAITRPKGSNTYIGLLGQGDESESNEFKARNGTFIPISIISDLTKEDFTALDDEKIFDNFGKEWEIKSGDDSLFDDISGIIDGQSFNTFFQPNFRPDFDSFYDLDRNNGRKLQGPPDNNFCAEYENAFIRQACVFDFSITGNEALVRSTSDFAEKEKVIEALLLNTPPGIHDNGRSQNTTVGINIDAVFMIESFDIDMDTVSAELTRNDGTLFELSNDESIPGKFEVQFLGSSAVGSFRAHVTLTDGMTPVLVTINVVVVSKVKCASSMSPSFGPEVGGTVVKIENGSSGGCPLRSDADILCRFENDDKSFSNLVPGILVKLEGSNIVECVSPFSGQPMNVRVSYAAILNDFDIDEATFFEVDEEFQYIRYQPSPSPAPFSSPQDSSNIPYYTFPPTINADSSYEYFNPTSESTQTLEPFLSPPTSSDYYYYYYYYYYYPQTPSVDCNDDTPNTTPFRIEIQHGDDPYYPEELFWKVSQEQGLGYTIEIASGYLPEGNEFYEEKLCLDSRECYFFELEHYYNYALYDGGTFMIFYDDNIIGEGGAFEGTFESIRFGNRCTSPQRNLEDGYEKPTSVTFSSSDLQIIKKGLRGRNGPI